MLDRLVERLMRILVESAGARSGFLVLARDGRLEVAAEITVDPDSVRLGLTEDVQTCSFLPATVVQYVARSSEAVVLSDAANDERFAGDPYVVRTRPKSLLCVAMRHQGRLTGALYFENDLATHAFSPAHIELLQFLAAQAAIALENAKLYGEVRAATDQLRRANETLEVQVAQRTDELTRTLAELWSEVDLARKDPDGASAGRSFAASLRGRRRHGPRLDGRRRLLRRRSVEGIGLATLIGDVSGHGVTAGLIMMMVQTAARTIITTADGVQHLTPAGVLSRVNAAVRGHLQRIGADQYMTLTALEVRTETVRHSGLHQDILVYRSESGRVERIETRGVWIGLLDDISDLLEDSSFTMTEGDVLLLFTDGLSERVVDGGRLGTDGLVRLFQGLASETRDVGVIVKGIMRSLEGCAIDDDITVMAARYAPPAFRCPMKARLATSLSPEKWPNIRIHVRREVGEALETYPAEIRCAAMMTASELMENAIQIRAQGSYGCCHLPFGARRYRRDLHRGGEQGEREGRPSAATARRGHCVDARQAGSLHEALDVVAGAPDGDGTAGTVSHRLRGSVRSRGRSFRRCSDCASEEGRDMSDVWESSSEKASAFFITKSRRSAVEEVAWEGVKATPVIPRRSLDTVIERGREGPYGFRRHH